MDQYESKDLSVRRMVSRATRLASLVTMNAPPRLIATEIMLVEESVRRIQQQVGLTDETPAMQSYRSERARRRAQA